MLLASKLLRYILLYKDALLVSRICNNATEADACTTVDNINKKKSREESPLFQPKNKYK
jgi:hypothetical protein